MLVAANSKSFCLAVPEAPAAATQGQDLYQVALRCKHARCQVLLAFSFCFCHSACTARRSRIRSCNQISQIRADPVVASYAAGFHAADQLVVRTAQLQR
eukprot:8158-Heterococcus_DN1.PRE.5